MITAELITDFKNNFSKLADEPDTFLADFLNSAHGFIVKLSGLTEIPLVDTGATDPVSGDPVMEWDIRFKQAVFTRALFEFQSRDFPRPQIEQAVTDQILNLISHKTDFTERTALTEATA